MLLAELQRKIIENKLDSPFYIFDAQDRTIVDLYLDQIEKVTGMRRVCVDDLLSSLKNSHKGSLTASARKMIVIRDDKSVISDEKLWPLFNGNNLLIFIYSSIDKRTLFHKTFESVIVPFPKLSTEMLKEHLSSFIQLPSKALEYIISRTDNIVGYAKLEIDKINQLSQAEGISQERAFTLLASTNNIGSKSESKIFQAVDALFNANFGKFIMYIEEEEPLQILGLLYSSIKSTWLVKSYGNRSDIAQQTGLSDMIIRINRSKRCVYSLEGLKQLLLLAISIEQDIKFGKIAMEDSVAYFVIKAYNIYRGDLR